LERTPAGLLKRLALPVNPLDMLVHLGGQAVAAFLAAALENVATTFGGHTGPETVDARPAADFGLVGSFGHDLLTSMQK
jgi:hypothetical protein